MFIRILGILIVFAAGGCESVSTIRQNSESHLSGPPPVVLTSLSKSPSQADLSEQLAFPDVTETGSGEQNVHVDPFPTVYFPYDSWEISSDVQTRLDATANWMNRFKDYELTIEGHTDIRGTESYNMVLGARRAKAVQEYLANLGIQRNRLEVVSYGKTLVLCEVDDEYNCHQFNRRADLFLE